MKIFKIITPFCFLLTLGSCSSTNKAIVPISFQEIRAQQLKKSEVTVTLIAGSSWTANPLTISLMKLDHNWIVLKYQDKSLSWEADFIEQHKCDSGQAVFDKLVFLGALTLPSEKDLKTPCRSLKDTIVDGKAAVEIRDASQDSDAGFFKLKVNLPQSSREIFYYDPNAALKICPLSPERIAFLEIMKIINSL